MQGTLVQLAQDMPAPLPSFLAMHHFDAPGAKDGRATNDEMHSIIFYIFYVKGLKEASGSCGCFSLAIVSSLLRHHPASALSLTLLRRWGVMGTWDKS